VIRVGVVGAGGRMGSEVCRAVSRDPDLELVAAVDPVAVGRTLSEVAGLDGPGAAIEVAARVDALVHAGAAVAVDFTVAEVATETMRFCAGSGIHAVVGTTGISAAQVAEIESLFSSSDSNCIMAANFAIGAVLMMRFAAMAAVHMDGAEIVEMHHDNKRDAPSGTALATARSMADARSSKGLAAWHADRTSSETVPGSRGAVAPGNIRVHAMRLPGLVAHQEVVLGSLGQSLSIRHDAYDRTSFMPGVVLAVKSVPKRRGLTVGLDALLDL
jgi:4-hydroxy-tetrahydrodipicolinate reductase